MSLTFNFMHIELVGKLCRMYLKFPFVSLYHTHLTLCPIVTHFCSFIQQRFSSVLCKGLVLVEKTGRRKKGERGREGDPSGRFQPSGKGIHLYNNK